MSIFNSFTGLFNTKTHVGPTCKYIINKFKPKHFHTFIDSKGRLCFCSNELSTNILGGIFILRTNVFWNK